MTEPNHSDRELLVETIRRFYGAEHAYHVATSELALVKHKLQQADYHGANESADKIHELETELQTLRQDAKSSERSVEMATERIEELEAENKQLRVKLEAAYDDIRLVQDKLRHISYARPAKGDDD